jgi:hypothetical protein
MGPLLFPSTFLPDVIFRREGIFLFVNTLRQVLVIEQFIYFVGNRPMTHACCCFVMHSPTCRLKDGNCRLVPLKMPRDLNPLQLI